MKKIDFSAITVNRIPSVNGNGSSAWKIAVITIIICIIIISIQYLSKDKSETPSDNKAV